MDFLASPVHNYSYETFDDAFFELPKEMDFEITDELRDTMVHSVDDDDLNDGMYGVWNAKHPWSVNNNSSSIYNSNLHLDFIGGDPDSAMMVNPNVVIPSGFQFDEEDVKPQPKEEIEEPCLPAISTFSKLESKESSSREDCDLSSGKKAKSKFLSVNESITSNECNGTSVPKNGIRILKPTAVESSISNGTGNTSHRSENGNGRLKNSSKNNSVYYREGQFYPKPAFSYSCLIAMALKNSKHGCLPVAEIYNFMCNHFPYFKTAPNGWKNSVRHNLSLNKCFEKIEKPAGSTQRKGCLWALNPINAAKLEEEVQKCTKKDVAAIKRAMEYPEHLELLERGELKSLYDTEQGMEDDDDDDDLDANEEDMDAEESTTCGDDIAEEKQSADEEHRTKKAENESAQYPILNMSETNGLPEFNIEVDDSIYEELIGTIKNEQLFTINEPTLNSAKSSPAKKIKKYFIQVNRESGKKTLYHSKRNESEIFDHYDINNLLRFENEAKLSSNKKTPRFNRRDCSNSRIKQIKFKTWN